MLKTVNIRLCSYPCRLFELMNNFTTIKLVKMIPNFQYLTILTILLSITLTQSVDSSPPQPLHQPYNSMLDSLKQQLRQFHKNPYNLNFQAYPLPTKGYQLLNIIDEDGQNNKKLENDIKNCIGNVWDQQGRIKVVLWIGREYYKQFWEQNVDGFIQTAGFPKDMRPLVSISGQIRDYFLENKQNKVNNTEQASIRVAQLLGLPVHYVNGSLVTNNVFIQIWVDPLSLFRLTRAAQTKANTTMHDLVWRIPDDYNPDPNYYQKYLWKLNIENQTWQSIPALQPMTQPNRPFYLNSFKNDVLYRLIGQNNDDILAKAYPYPFTGLGYTFNWCCSDFKSKDSFKSINRVGVSNFLIKGGTKYEIAGVYETFNYVTETEVKSIKDIIGSNVPANFVSSDFPIII